MSTITTASTLPIAGVIESLIRIKIENEYSPTFISIENESYKHNVPKGSESHFKVLIVSNVFEGKKLIDRHRMINKTLAEELKSSIHALSIHAKTPLEYSQQGKDNIPNTPNCMGGSK